MKPLALVVAFLFCLPPIAIGVLGVRYTWRKLDKMDQIRGFKPAADFAWSRCSRRPG
jgi:hypothetical protein